MSDVEAKSERGRSADLRVVSSAQSAARAIHRTRIRIVPLLITLATASLPSRRLWRLSGRPKGCDPPGSLALRYLSGSK
jgi:hypothetical protein